MTMWRVGSKVPLNVYDGDRPVCQCHTAEDAEAIVRAMNMAPGGVVSAEERSRIIGRHQRDTGNPMYADFK